MSNLIISTTWNKSLSSFSQSILESCLSVKNRETILLRQQEKEIFDDEFSPFLINSLEDLKKMIQKSIELLEESQISVERDFRRQLIPISLMSYTQSNSPFKTE